MSPTLDSSWSEKQAAMPAARTISRSKVTNRMVRPPSADLCLPPRLPSTKRDGECSVKSGYLIGPQNFSACGSHHGIGLKAKGMPTKRGASSRRATYRMRFPKLARTDSQLSLKHSTQLT